MKNKGKNQNKKQQKSAYSQLKIKIIFYLLGILAAAYGVVFFLGYLFRKNHLADWIVALFQQQFNLNYTNAKNLYWGIHRYSELIQIIFVVLLFLLLLCSTLKYFLKYFDIISQRVDALTEEETSISLPSELSFLEYKLNYVRQTLKQRSMEAKAEEQRKNELVMYLAHDIRTPLTSVIGYLSLLEEIPDMPTEQRIKYIHIILNKAGRLEKMVDEFFEITRYNIQQMVLKKEKIDLYYMLVQLLDEFSGILDSHGNTTVLTANEDIMVYADPEKLARVFNNILKNAVAYSYCNTEIMVSAKEKDEKIIISFQNKGSTIPKEKLSVIFEKFYRLDEARTSNSSGNGLGLAIAKEIVTAHNGTISVLSENNITSFEVALPVVN